MKVSFDVKMTVKNLYEFLMRHTFSKPSGWLGVVLGLVGLGFSVYSIGRYPASNTGMYALFSVILIIYQPLSLYSRAQKNIKMNRMYKKPLHYEMDEEGISCSQEEEKVMFGWDDVVMVTNTRNSLIVYTGRITAFVLPWECMGTQQDTAKTLIKNHVSTEKLKLK